MPKRIISGAFMAILHLTPYMHKGDCICYEEVYRGFLSQFPPVFIPADNYLTFLRDESSTWLFMRAINFNVRLGDSISYIVEGVQS